MTPPANAREEPAMSVMRPPRRPPVQDSATASIQPRSARRSSTTCSSERSSVEYTNSPAHASGDGRPVVRLERDPDVHAAETGQVGDPGASDQARQVVQPLLERGFGD